ncbi:MAG: ABC transporter substrate-binding protein [Rhodospirillales bacterium]|nr:ABC transporter substrate-binding protein [Rhodospirillales bacterium]
MMHAKQGSGVSRRRLLAGAGAATLGAPLIAGAAPAPVKIGLLQPLTGFLAYDGIQGKYGAMLAIDEINAAGGIKSLGGAKLAPVLADAQTSPATAIAEVDRLAGEGVAAIQGGFASDLVLAATQQAARHGLPYMVDVGVVDQIVGRGLTNTFRFGPGFGKVTQDGLANLAALNNAAGKPAKTVVIVHENGAFGSGMAKLLQAKLPGLGFEVVATIGHPTPQRDFTNIALQVKQANPDLIIPSNYKNDYILMALTFAQQHVRPKAAIYSILGGAASNAPFAAQHPKESNYIMDCNHYYDPNKPLSKAFAAKVAAKKWDLTYELMLNYSVMRVLADALERAASTDAAKLTAAIAASTYSDTIMPYGPTKFVHGQNIGAAPVNTQIRDGVVEVIFPTAFASAKPVFPIPAAG